MELRNYSSIPTITFDALDKNKRQFHVIVIRATLEFGSGGMLRLAGEQSPPNSADDYYGEMNTSSVRQESDFVPFKPKCDVIVNATAYAPANRPARSFPAGIRINTADRPRPIPPEPYGLNPTLAPSPAARKAWEDEIALVKNGVKIPGDVLLNKTLKINGPRCWKKNILGGWDLERSTPIDCLPIRYEHAYGGQCRVENGTPASRRVKKKHLLTEDERRQHAEGIKHAPAAHVCCLQNPIGIGFCEPWYTKALKLNSVPAPQIESPHHPIKTFGQGYHPQGFGVVNKSWKPRIDLAGTYDDAWLKDIHPMLPDDFNFGFWNGAPADMQIAYLSGHETVHMQNLTPEGDMHFSLPGLRPYLLAHYEDGKNATVRANLDTLIIEPDLKQVSLVWRTMIPIEPGVRMVQSHVVTKEEFKDLSKQIKELSHA